MAERQGVTLQLDSIARAPGLRQLLLLIAIAVSVAVGVVVVLWAQGPSYTTLFNGLADRDAAQIVQALELAGIPYELSTTGGTLQVPAERVSEARLKLAGEGLPQSGGSGMELIKDETGFGVSEFIETARYQHMLETELVRTISSMHPVQSARVHLALPKQSVFLRDAQSASASVALHLYPGRQLQDTQVGAIVHLVAASVPNVEAQNVTVVDQRGRLLTDPDTASDMALTNSQFEHVARVEAKFTRNVENILVPILGADRVRANVTVDMDFTTTEEARETYDPNRVALRSEATTFQENGAADAVQGVPGALSNQPPVDGAIDPQLDTPAIAARNTSRTSTRNFEVDRAVTHIRQPADVIRRLSVVVIVDERKQTTEEGVVESIPLTAEEKDRLTALVRGAVGFDEARGDLVLVSDAPFQSTEAEPMESPQWWQQPSLRDLVKQGLGALLVLAVLMTTVRPFVRSLLQPPPPMPALASGIGGDTDADTPALPMQGANPAMPAISHDERMNDARSLASEDPRRVAQVVKDWVAADA